MPPFAVEPTAPNLYKSDEPSDSNWESEVVSEIEIPAQADRQTRPSSVKQQNARNPYRKPSKDRKNKKIDGCKRKACAECHTLHRRCEHKNNTKPAGQTRSNGVPKLSSYAPPRAPPRIERAYEEKINRERVVTAPLRVSPQIEKGDEIERERVVTIPLGKAIRLAERNKLVQILDSLCEGNRIIADRVIHELLKDSME